MSRFQENTVCLCDNVTIPHSGTVNKTGDTPLSLASNNGQLDTVKYLVEVHHCDPRGEYLIYVEHFQ